MCTDFCVNMCFQFSWVFTWGWNCWVMRITLSLNPCQHLLMSFWLQSSWRVWSGISLWLWCAFPSWLAILTIFSRAICMCLLENCIWIFCPFFNWVVRFFMYFGYKSLFRYVIYKYSLPFCGLLFHFLDDNLGNTSFYFWWSPIYLFPLVLVLVVSYFRKTNAYSKVMKISACFLLRDL